LVDGSAPSGDTAVGSFYIGLGWLENLKAFPPAYITFLLSLIAFWAMLLLKENEGKTKVALFVVFSLLGMIGAQAFTFFPHALRVVMKDYSAALLDPTVSILRHTGPLMFVTVVLVLFAIHRRFGAVCYLGISGAQRIGLVVSPDFRFAHCSSIFPGPLPAPISISCSGRHTRGFNLHIRLLDGWSTRGHPCHLAANPLLQRPLI